MVAVNNFISIKSLIEESGVCFGTSGMRGLAANMTDHVCRAYTTAFLQEIVPHAKRVVLGHDLRPSSLGIVKACASAILARNIEVIFAGALPTPALAWYAQQENIPVIMVTGSHIPFDRNGIKFYSSAGEISKEDELAITNAIVEDVEQFIEPTLVLSSVVMESYRDRYVQFFPANFLHGMRIGVYEHSSVARDFLSALLRNFGAEVVSLGRTNDFVPVDTEAVSEETQALGKKWAIQYQLDAIVSTDGDADRPLISDEQGNWLRGDTVGLLCANYLKANTVVTPVSTTTAVERSHFFKNVIRTKIGSPYVIKEMQTALNNGQKNVVGFEANGGFLVGDTIRHDEKELLPSMTRDAVLPILALLALTKEKAISFSELQDVLPNRFTASGRIANFGQEKSKEVFAFLSTEDAINTFFGDICGKFETKNEIDGLRLTFKSGNIIHLRQSGNAPELRCYVESDTSQKANHVVKNTLKNIMLLNLKIVH